MRDPVVWGAIFTGVIAVATVLYVVFTVGLWRQTKASAGAAQRSAEVLINSERAWVIPELEWNQGAHLVDLTTIEKGERVQKTGAMVVLICRNHGKAPGWIEEKKIVLEIAEALPNSPNLEGVSTVQIAVEPLPPGIESKTNVMLDCVGRTGDEKKAFFYGVIRYRDTFDRARETTFGYVVTSDRRLERLGLPAYNKAT